MSKWALRSLRAMLQTEVERREGKSSVCDVAEQAVRPVWKLVLKAVLRCMRCVWGGRGQQQRERRPVLHTLASRVGG